MNLLFHKIKEATKAQKMKLRWFLFPVIGLLFSLNTYAQSGSFSITGKSIPELTQENQEKITLPFFKQANEVSLEKEKPTPPSLRQFFNSPLTVSKMPKAYSYQDLGFFCKLEVQMEKRAKFPVKVRLGEVQYVERMEGKLE